MLKTTPMLKPHDILINDRGFLSRDLLNYLKIHRQVDTYIPLKQEMLVYKDAISIAKIQNEWQPHPNPKRKKQVISFAPDVGTLWQSSEPQNDVPINACVVWDKDTDQYFVFVTTDLKASAKDIINTYELRPEIEEDYRQLKDFWKIEDFKSTKINVILFHVVCVLFGYLFFQLYTLLPEGEEFLHKSLPIILKAYMPVIHPYVVLYSEDEFAVITLFELLDVYANSSENVQRLFKTILNK